MNSVVKVLLKWGIRSSIYFRWYAFPNFCTQICRPLASSRKLARRLVRGPHNRFKEPLVIELIPPFNTTKLGKDFRPFEFLNSKAPAKRGHIVAAKLCHTMLPLRGKTQQHCCAARGHKICVRHKFSALLGPILITWYSIGPMLVQVKNYSPQLLYF